MTQKPNKWCFSEHWLQQRSGRNFIPQSDPSVCSVGICRERGSLQSTQFRPSDHPSGSLEAESTTWYNIKATNLLETNWTFLLPWKITVPLSFTLPHHVWPSLNHIALGWYHCPGSKIPNYSSMSYTRKATITYINTNKCTMIIHGYDFTIMVLFLWHVSTFLWVIFREWTSTEV